MTDGNSESKNDYVSWIKKGVDYKINSDHDTSGIHIIAISGRARSGKNALGESLQHKINRMGINCELFSFANPIKKMTQVLLNVKSERDLERNKDLVVNDISIRKLFQFIGTQFRDEIDIDFWVKLCIRNIRLRHLHNGEGTFYAIITDLRFPNELKIIKQCNAEIIYLEREEGIK